MDIKAYRQATIQAAKFLLSQQDEDGSFKPVDMGVATYYKVPYALALMGQCERASRLCTYLLGNVMDEEGDFVGHFSRSDLHERYYLVANAWLIAGAQRLGQFGISLRGVDFVGSLQHATSGGFYWRFDHDTAPGYPAYGYTEDTIFGTLGLMASASYGSYDVEIQKGIAAVLSGFLADGSMGDHLWEPSFTAHVFAGEALRLAIPEPTSAALLGGCLATLAWRRRRRRGARRATTERL